MTRRLDLVGQTFGYLTAIEFSHLRRGRSWWKFSCKCGRVITRNGHPVKVGKIKSCGCMTSKMVSSSTKKHGRRGHPAYRAWCSMKQRCHNPKHPAFHRYGGRGIFVCPRWRNGFENFWEDIGHKYKPGLELDRRNNSKGYSKGNCRWVSHKINNNNTRTNRIVDTPKGKMTLSQASEAFGIKTFILAYRLNNNWPPQLVFKPTTKKE